MSDALFDKVKRQMRDLIYGRSIAPTREEAAKHDGEWLIYSPLTGFFTVVTDVRGFVHLDGCSWPVEEFATMNPGNVWRPIGEECDLVAWPEVTS